MGKNGFRVIPDKIGQKVHNIIIAEENSELHIITGCSVSHAVNSALHLGISEFYVKKGAKIIFTMIHNWSRGMEVRPRSAVIIEDGGVGCRIKFYNHKITQIFTRTFFYLW